MTRNQLFENEKLNIFLKILQILKTYLTLKYIVREFNVFNRINLMLRGGLATHSHIHFF